MSSMEQARTLLKERDAVDEEMSKNLLVLTTNNTDMKTSLIDEEGFPLSDIDVYAVRHARHNLICLKNDRDELTKKIEECMEHVHQEAANGEGTNDVNIDDKLAEFKPVHRTSNDPFVKVTEVTNGSPASLAGFQVNDMIIQFGSIHAGNFTDLQAFAAFTKGSADSTLRVTALRDEKPVHLEIRPRIWTGSGLLGCKVAPITPGKSV